jgi:uncharacterized repeat protein (TIGR02543 family)
MWEKNDSLPTTVGNYYLTQNVELTSTWGVPSGTVLCLNGHSITRNGDGGVIFVGAYQTVFTLTDCNGFNSTHYGYWSGDSYVVTEDFSNLPESYEAFTGGLITGGTEYGVKVEGTSSTLYMYGGNIVGNTGRGIVGINSTASINIYKGTVAGNAGGISTEEGGCTIYEGYILDNRVNGSGGGVFTKGGLTMYNGSISGNTATENGGGVRVLSDFTMKNGTIANNTAGSSGGGVYANRTVYLYGGTIEITGNKSTNQGGGVYLGDQSLHITGNVTIKDNAGGHKAFNANVSAANVYMFYGTIYVDGDISDSCISVSKEYDGAFTSGWGANHGNADESVFISDSGYRIWYNNSGEVEVHAGHGFYDNPTCACGAHRHYVTSQSEYTYFETWDESTSLPTEAGNYVLTQDITIDTTWHPVDGIFLDLNGHSVRLNGTGSVIQVDDGVTFNLYDCNKNGTSHKFTVDKDGLWNLDEEDGTETISGGVITGGSPGLIVKGTFNLYAGLIAGNRGGVYLAGGSFKQSGGSVTRNTASNGGGVYLADGSFEQSGGSVTHNTASNGGGVYLAGGSFKQSGGSITSNTADIGGGVYLAGGSFEQSGGSITGNTASNGGGVYLASDGAFSVNGASRITGNTGGNVYLSDGKTISVAGSVSSASIGITIKNGTGTFTNGWNLYNSETSINVFVSDDILNYEVGKVGDELSLQTHIHNYDTTSGVCTCGQHQHKMDGTNDTVFVAWSDANSLPEEAGNYVLETDVSIDSTWQPADGTSLDLNGHSIRLSGTSSVYVGSGVTFALMDCNEGWWQGIEYSGGNGVYVGENGTFKMYSGGIFCNYDSGVKIAGGQFYLYGGTIRNNSGSLGGGVYVESGAFYLSGGSIICNDASSAGGGVYVASGATFAVTGGDAQVKENQAYHYNNEDDYEDFYDQRSDDDIFLVSGSKIQILGILGSNASMGVSMETFGTFTSGWSEYMSDTIPTDYFFADDEDYYAAEDEGELILKAFGFDEDGISQTSGYHRHVYDGYSTKTFVPWTKTDSLPTQEGCYVLSNDVILTESWEAPSNVVLDLNGHNITMTGTGSVISVSEWRSLTLYDCKGTGNITGGQGENGGGIYVDSGSVYLYGGNITANTARGDGGGIYINSGSVYLYGGNITGNTASGNGGGIGFNAGQVSIYGGKVIGNKAGGKENNVYVTSSDRLYFGYSVSEDTLIGISMEEPGTFLSTTNGVNADLFFSDDTAYAIQLETEEHSQTYYWWGRPWTDYWTTYTLRLHEPTELVYTAEGNTITQTCTDDCGLTAMAILSAEDAPYTGQQVKPAAVTYSNHWVGAKDLTIDYENNVNMGTATACVTVGDKTAKVEFTVTLGIQPTPSTDVVTIDYKTETVSFGDEYEMSSSTDESITPMPSGSTIIPGETYYVRLKARENYNPSDWTAILIPSRPSEPSDLIATAETSKGQANGKISGVNSTMEYKHSTADSWTSVSGTELTGLSADTYQVRVKATDNAFCSLPTEIIVSEGGPLTVTLNSNGGSSVKNIEGLSYNAPAGTLPVPTLAGYTFGGWYNGDTRLTATTQIIANVTYTARWTLNVPIVTAGKNYTATYDGQSHEISITANHGLGTSSLSYQWQKLSTNSWTDISGATKSVYAVTNVNDSGKYRCKVTCIGGTQTKEVFSTEITVTIKKASQHAPSTNAVTIDYANETISFSTEYEMSTNNSGNGTSVSSGSTIVPGEIYYVRLKEKENYNPSDWTEIEIPSRPSAPSDLAVTAETAKGQADGKISGVNSTMEYKRSTSDSWVPISGTKLTGLSADTYQVRVKATDSAFTGTLTTVTIGEGNSFTITLDSNGGSEVKNIEGLSYNAQAGTLPVPTRTGYIFIGWYDGDTQLTATTQITSNVTYTAQWTANPYTVIFNANGGIGSMGEMSLTYDLALNLPQNTFTRQGYYFSGWALDQNGAVVYGDGQSIKNLTTVDGGSVTLYAQWNKNPTYAISGMVVNGENGTVSVIKGNETLLQTTCDRNGSFDFSGIESGAYNLVATSGDGLRTVTSLVTLSDGDKSGLELKLPEENVNSVLNVEENTPAVVVGRLDSEAQAVKAVNTGSTSVTVTMTVESKEDVTVTTNSNPGGDNVPDEATEKLQTAQTAIKETAGDVTLTFLEITVEKTVTSNDQTTTETMRDTTNLMEIIVPFNMNSKENVTVYRYHDGASEALKQDPVNGEEGFVVGSDSVTVYAKKFSTYAIGYTVVESDGSSPDSVTDTVKDPLGTSVVPAEDSTTDHSNCPSLAYSDVDVTKWYHEAIDFAISNQLMVGYSGKFEPDSNLTRGMMAQILYNRQGRPAVTISSIFRDVACDRWYTSAISWAAKTGVVVGCGDGTFQPERYITREQLATMLWRYSGEPAAIGKLDSFTDSADISNYALDAMKWATECGILNGMGDGKLEPRGQATRAQVAQMMENYLKREVS